MFDDLLQANAAYRAGFHDPNVAGSARRHLAVLTCIDSRIDPLAMLGLSAGDAKIIRNAGARVTDDALRSLILAANLLGANRICVVQHTDCALAGRTDDDLRARLAAELGAEVDLPIHAMPDQRAALVQDLERIRTCPLIPAGTVVGGFLFDVHTGGLTPFG